MKLKRKCCATKSQRQKTDDSKERIRGIPMKHRKFPKSFWQQPNRPNQNVHEDIVDKDEIFHTRTGHIKITSAPDTNLLFSLFKILKQDTQQIVESGDATSVVANSSLNTKKSVAEDEDTTTYNKELTCLDDPYMSPEEDCRGLKKSLKSSKNYSELLSDLVVNL